MSAYCSISTIAQFFALSTINIYRTYVRISRRAGTGRGKCRMGGTMLDLIQAGLVVYVVGSVFAPPLAEAWVAQRSHRPQVRSREW